MPGPSSPTHHNHHHQSHMNDAACSRLAVLVAAKSHSTQHHQPTTSASAGGAFTTGGVLNLYSVTHQPQGTQAVSITPTNSVLAPSTSAASSFKAREAVWSADGRHYATTGLISQSSSSSSSTSSTVSIHDAVTSKIVEIVPLPPSSDKSSIFGAIAFGTRKSSRSLYLAVGGNTQKWQVHVWDRKDRKYILTFSPHSAAISCLAVNQDEMFVMSGSINGDLKVHSLRTNTPLHLQSPFSQTVNACAFSPFKRTLAAAVGDDGILALYDVNTTSLAPVFVLRDAHHAPIHGLAWSPCNSSLLATAGLDSRVRLYSKDEKWRCIWEAQTDAPATSVSMDDTFLLVYGTLSGQVAVHDTRHRNTAPLDIMDLNSAITKTVFEPAKWVKDSAAKDIGVTVTGPTTSVSGSGFAGSRPITPPPHAASAVSAKAGSTKPASSPVVAAFKERVANLKAKAAAQNATTGGGGAALDLFSPVAKPVATGQDKFANLNARVKELREQQKKTSQVPETVGDKVSARGGVGGMTIAKPTADMKVQRNTMMDLFSPVTAGGRVQTTAPKVAAPTMPAFQEFETKPDPPKTPPTQRQAQFSNNHRPPVAGPVSQSTMRPSSPTPSPIAAKPFTMASSSEFFESTSIPFQNESAPFGVDSLMQPPSLAQRTPSAGSNGNTKSTPAGTGIDAMRRMRGALNVLRSGKSGPSTPASVTGAVGPANAISGAAAPHSDRSGSGSSGRRAVSFDINRVSDGVSGGKKAPVVASRRVVSAEAGGSMKAHDIEIQDVSESRLEDVDADYVDEIVVFGADVPGSVIDAAANAVVQSASEKAEKIGLETVEVLVDSGVDPGLWELAANDEGPSSTAVHEWLPDEEDDAGKLTGGIDGLMGDDVGQAASTTGGGSVSIIQRRILEGVMEECLAGFRAEMKEDIRNMHLEMLRQFHVQKNEIEMMLKKHSPMEALLGEVKQLREENARLRCGY